jgi:hypothetical protein
MFASKKVIFDRISNNFKFLGSLKVKLENLRILHLYKTKQLETFFPLTELLLRNFILQNMNLAKSSSLSPRLATLAGV